MRTPKTTPSIPSAFTAIEAGQKARRAFRKWAKPGVKMQIFMTKPDPTPDDILVLVGGKPIGMIMSIGVQVSADNGFSMYAAWPRENGFFAQENWEVEAIQPSVLFQGTPDGSGEKHSGMQFSLVRDRTAENPVDPEFLEEESDG